MGSKSPTQQTQSQTSAPNPTALAAYNNVVGQAQTAAATPYQAYTGELTAGTNAQEAAGTSTLNNAATTAAGYYGQAGSLANASTAAVNPTAVDGAAISQYSNPFQSQVINATEAQMANTDQQQNQQQTSQAISAGAFGGDRAGVAQAALAGQQDIANNTTLANLNSSNYTQALGEANTQQATTLAAQQANRTALGTAANTEAGLGSAASASGVATGNAQLGAGALSQQTQQAADTAAYGQFENQQAYPFQTTQYLANIVEGIEPNTGTTTSGTSSTSAPSAVNSIVGGGLGLASILSDRRAKEDIKVIGKTFDGQPMYSYRYKGEDVTRVGLMAQDVEKKHPDAIGSLGHLKTVDYKKATAAAADKGHFAAGGGVGLGNIGGTPYANVGGYVPTGSAMPSAHVQSPTLNFSQGQGLGAATAQNPGMQNVLSGAKLLNNSSAGDAINDGISDGMSGLGSSLGLARGGNVSSLADARARRGYDGGGVVPDADAMVFDPAALATGTDGGATFAPGISGSNDTSGFVPTQPTGLGAAMAPAGPASYSDPSSWGGAGLGLASSQPAAPQPGLAPVDPVAMNDPATWSDQPLGSASPVANDNQGLRAASNPPVQAGQPLQSAQAYAAPADDGSASPAVVADSGTAPTTGLGAINAATAPRNVRNNNPGNIEDGAFAQKQPGYAGSDGRFARFETPAAGAGAQDTLLAGYGSQGLNTPLSIVSKWAPKGDGNNDPVAYASSVAKQLGIGINDQIDMSNPVQRAALGKAMANVEGGTGSGGSGGSPVSGGLGGALAYSSQAGSDAAAKTLGAASSASPAASGSWTDNFGSAIGGTGSATFGHSGGVLGLFPGMSDDARMGLAAAGLGMMASPSRNWGMAIGQGGLKGIEDYQASRKLTNQQAVQQAQIGNLNSETVNRPAMLGVERDRVNIAAQQLQRELGLTAAQIKNETQRTANETAKTGPEVAGRNAETALKMTTATPGGLLVRDPANPENIKIVPWSKAVSNGDPSAAPGGGAPAVAPGPGGSPAAPTASSGRIPLPANIPTNPMMFSPEGQKMAFENSKATMDDARPAYEASQNTKVYLGDMQHDLAQLPATGMLAQGPGQAQRAAFGSKVNAVVHSLGFNGDLYDPKGIAATEDVGKISKKMGFELSKGIGGKEPGFIVQQAVATVPSSDNSPMGAQRLIAGIQSMAQRNEDRFNFLTDWSQARGGDLTGADDAFNKASPPAKYVAQAVVSSIDPRAVAMLRSNPSMAKNFDAKYGVGTSRYALGQ